MHAPAPPFEEHCGSALEGLRSALIDLYTATGAEPDAPQKVSRRFGVNRNLAWKVARILRAESPRVVFQHLPGGAGLEILLKAFGERGAADGVVEGVRAALAEYERMVEIHAGDRATLELMLDSLSPEEASTDSLELSRKLAFRGNSGIWGMQAKVRLRTVFVAPSPEDPSWLDTAQISGLIDLRRFRHGAVWPLFAREDFDDHGVPRPHQEVAIDPNHGGPSGSQLIEEFCSRPLPKIRTVSTRLGVRQELVGGSLGNTGRTTCIHGTYQRRFAPRHRDENNVRGEFFTRINAPAETLLFDLIFHRSLEEEMDLDVHLLRADSPGPYLMREATGIPFAERLRSLGPTRPHVATPSVPRYGEIVERIYDRLAWDAQSFRGVRLEMQYPPLTSDVVLSYPLPAAED